VDVGAPGGECGNAQTGGWDRVSTISILGCSTSVALAMCPTDKEEDTVKYIVDLVSTLGLV
jgi:hypothetical protein